MPRKESPRTVVEPRLVHLAWNGASLDVPEDWEPARLGRTYLYLEDGSGPALECKWTAAKKQLSPDAALKRLTRESGETIAPVEEKAIRPAWAQALAQTEARVFSWKTPHMSGLGAVFRPKDGGPLTILRFYRVARHARDGQEALWDGVIRSFTRQRAEQRKEFEIYDIRLTAPAGRELKTFSFKPGAFELEFEGGRESLTYARFAPAEAILRGKTLEEWTRGAFGLKNADLVAPVREDADGHPGLRFAAPGPDGALYRGLLRAACAVSGRRRFTGGIVRHYPEKNRLLCLTARGTKTIDPERLISLEKEYGTL